ncbi:MAG: EAL domain-containing protein, partial [Gammaproteobacteria bacterium]|nr:EAL domain-containing protein [Gammaproteobacteria bacterium]
IGILLPAKSNNGTQNIKELEQSLSAVAECVARESELIGELDLMANELALRYEELNLLYDVAEEGDVGKSECEQSLQDLVRSCGQHLDARVAAVVLPQQKIVIFHATDDETPHEVNRLLRILEREVCPWVSANRRQLVINDQEEPLRGAAAPSFEGKMMTCPVLNEVGSTYGIIAVTRPDSEADFTTGDRRLLEVVATRAEKILQLSFDPLTGLMNRNEFIRALDRSLTAAHSRGLNYCLLVIEIDHLKIINDAFGHEAGDALLNYVSSVIRAKLEKDWNIVSRIGGAHFAVLVPGCSPDEGKRLATELSEKISSSPFCWRESRRNVTVSIGLATLDKQTQRAKTALYASEIACDVAQSFNTDRVAVYNEGDPLFLEKREDMRWVGLIQEALAKDRFVIYCQKIEALDETKSGVVFNEVLLRLRDESGGICGPGQFMPAAERFYLMPQIDRWVVRNLFRFIENAGNNIHAERQLWSINLSGQTLSDDGFLNFVTDEIHFYDIPPELVCFEITETAAVNNFDRAQRLINSLRSLGCSFSLDDFGTGLSSFGYLKSLRIDQIKIDGSFVKDMLQSKTSEAVVSSIIHLGHVLGVQVVAEWVEDKAIEHKLRDMGADFVQGFSVSEPLALDEWFRNFRKSDQVK